MIYDLVIIGGGPAGVAAGVYAARKKLNTLLLTFDFGGQSVVSADIQNWIGTKSISGEELSRQLKDHVASYVGEGFAMKEGVKVQKVEKNAEGFVVTDDSGGSYATRTVLVATGADRRKLNIPGAKEFEQKGITYCATCDGPLFAGKEVIVIGGGNAGFETAAQLLAYCKSVTLLHHRDEFKADAITVEKVRANPKAKLIINAVTAEVKGDKFANLLVYKDAKTGEVKELPTEGIFVEIGLVPTTYFVKDLVKLNDYGMVVTDPKTQQTSVPGIWAAGDCADGLYHQNNIAAGDAIKAIEDIYGHVHLGKLPN